jgi:NDP-4-keto-2,6-dideoxyhexose 3-C-methyltransferase
MYHVRSLLNHEGDTQVNQPWIWGRFKRDMDNLRSEVVKFITREVTDGKKVWGYGASTKGNTLLQYFGLDSSLIEGIAERSQYKYGTHTIGTNIPIFPEDDMRRLNPDYLLVLPWHFISEFRKREAEYLAGGGKLLLPCPRFEVISA